MAKASDKKADSDKTAGQKAKLLEILNDISTHDDKFEELVQLLEGIHIPGSYPDADQYHIFCQAYTIKLLQKYVINKDDREILLALYRLLEGYENFTTVKALHEHYAKEAFGYNKRIKVWKNPDSTLSKKEPKIIEKLTDRLMDVTANTPEDKGWLNLADIVVKELSERFPEGLPKKLPLPSPSYLALATTPQIAQVTNLPLAEEDLMTLEPPETKESTVGGVQPTAPIQAIEPDTSEENASTGGAEKNPQPVEPDIDPTPGKPEITQPQSRQPSKIHKPPVEELFPTSKEIILIPGEIFQLKVAILPTEAIDAPLSFVSLDPSIITVSTSGMLKAEKKPQKLLHNIKRKSLLRAFSGRTGWLNTAAQTIEIVIQAESGVTASKLVTVDYSRGSHKPPVADINDFVPSFTMSQQVRIVGSKDWATAVSAKVGDEVEFWIQYRNTSLVTQYNVAIRDVLPISLRYVAGTTILWNSIYDGAIHNEDTIGTIGFNIGHYDANSNAHVRFRAEVVEDFLVCGSNTLFNWSQVYADSVALQDYTAVIVNKR